MKKVFSHLLASTILFFGGVAVVNAQSIPAFSKYANPITYIDSFGTAVDSVPRFLLAMVDLIFLIAVPIIVIFIIYAGFLFVTAGDNESQISKARTVILWTLIGAGVLLGAKAISLAIQSTICALKDPATTYYFCP